MSVFAHLYYVKENEIKKYIYIFNAYAQIKINKKGTR